MAAPRSAFSDDFIAAGVPLLDIASGGSTPLKFSDEIVEHLATRHACGLFDFSFMGAWEFAGARAAMHLERLQTRDLRSIRPGQIAYTLLCRDDGTIFIDATVWMFSTEHYWLFSGRKSDAAFMRREAEGRDLRITRLDERLAVLALQGPRSGHLLATLIGEDPVRGLGYFHFIEARLFGARCQVARIGYSGELGYEIVVAAEQAAPLWRSLRDFGRPYGLLECGFIAADSLRIESGYILHSRELSRPRLPVEVGLQRLVTSESPAMRGRSALDASSDATRPGLVCAEIASDKFAASHAAYPLLELTSMAFSPLLGKRIGLGFTLPVGSATGTTLCTQDGVRMTVRELPCHDHARQRPRAKPLP